MNSLITAIKISSFVKKLLGNAFDYSVVVMIM